MKKAILFNCGTAIYAILLEDAINRLLEYGIITLEGNSNTEELDKIGYLMQNPEKVIETIATKTQFFFWESEWYLFLRPQNEGRFFADEYFQTLHNWSLTFNFNSSAYRKLLPKVSESMPLNPVYPSQEMSVWAINEGDEYGGAHLYRFKLSEGFSDGSAKYVENYVELSFVKKTAEGMQPGLQNEQLVTAILDRQTKLDAKYPSDQNKEMIAVLNQYLQLCKARIDDRINRGVMGELKK